VRPGEWKEVFGTEATGMQPALVARAASCGAPVTFSLSSLGLQHNPRQLIRSLAPFFYSKTFHSDQKLLSGSGDI